ncbi:MAG: neutral/alkaline non-lysosomal ceramidase N-terminal domain-containing protein [Eubacteriales bacterium]
MKFAISKRVITPQFSFVQQGFAARHDGWTNVHDELYATAAVIRANTDIIILSLDLISGDRSFEQAVYAALMEQVQIPPDNIILSYSHTHGALGIGNYGGDEAAGYRDFVLRTITDLVKEAMEHLGDAKMSLCKVSSDFGISRRYPSLEGILWKPYDNPESADHDLYLLKFEDEDDIRGILYSYACHPTSCGPTNLEITADFPGAVRSLLETEYPGCGVMFLQGCGADVKPVISVRGNSFVSLTAEEMTEGSRRLANDIFAGIHKSEWKNIDINFNTGSEEITLPCKNWDRSDWEQIADNPKQPDYRRNAARRAIEKYDRGELLDGLPFIIKCIQLTEGVRIICLENEMVNGYGQLIKRRLHGDTITLGYTGRICSYIPTAQILREGGYESETFLSAGIKGPFEEALEELITGTAQRLAEKAGKG